jgi:predicted nucleic acid-binding Zn ribbon protein
VKKVGDILREYLREKGWLTENPYVALFQDWHQVAGTALAAHTRLRDVREGVMIVEADHPGWLQMAGMHKAELLSAARKAAPAALLTGIRFVLAAGEQ